MKQYPASSGSRSSDLTPNSAQPIEIVRTGLGRLGSSLDRCAEVVSRSHREAPLPGDPIGEKVRMLIPEDDDISWLAQGIVDAKALLDTMEASQGTSDAVIANFLHRWGADTQAPAWAGKDTAERLGQTLELTRGLCKAKSKPNTMSPSYMFVASSLRLS